ncbi:MAG: hypothetical protein IJ256_10060 [Bacteroidaceae bacterium]|nr:hypothetical protein [Bacteroidaceae bacterium]
MKNLTWQNPGQLFVAQVLIKKVKLKCCGIYGKISFWLLDDKEEDSERYVSDIRMGDSSPIKEYMGYRFPVVLVK